MDNTKKGLLLTTKQNVTKYTLLLALIIILCLITYFRVKIQIYLGPGWDTYDFLSNALLFAGKGSGYYDLARPPLISFLTSIIFRFGYISETVIFAVDGVLFIFGAIGLFLLLNYRFNVILSFLGSILYATFPIVLNFLGFGLTDAPSVSFCIWTLYFIIMAVKNNSKYYYLAFPFLMLAFLMRFNSALLIIPIVFYILINRDSLKDIKDMLIGIFISFLIIIPFFIFFQLHSDNFLYPFLTSFGATGSSFSPNNYAYNSNLDYFIKGIPSYIGEEIYNIFKVIIVILSMIVIYSSIKTVIANRPTLNTLKSNKSKIIKFVIFLILLLLFIETFGNITYLQSLIIFFTLLFISYELLKTLKSKNIDMDLLIFSFFMTYFIFHSIFTIKVGRYFIVMAPAVAYFLVFGINEILNALKFKSRDKIIISSIISIYILFIALSSVSPYLDDLKKETQGFNEENKGLKSLNEKTTVADKWLIDYDPNYKEKVIYSDLWQFSAWHLKTNVKKMPIFKDGEVYYFGVRNYGISPEDNLAFNQELENSKADYYICIKPELNLTSYKQVYRIDELIIYKRNEYN